jgi:hypothetical protein
MLQSCLAGGAVGLGSAAGLEALAVAMRTSDTEVNWRGLLRRVGCNASGSRI